jgi:hypothetical protein
MRFGYTCVKLGSDFEKWDAAEEWESGPYDAPAKT